MNTNQTAAIYLHSPWCVQKCPYCDFNAYSQPSSFQLIEQAYLHALLNDIRSTKRFFPQYSKISSIYLGGGTPSLMSTRYWEKVFDCLRSEFNINLREIEITMEASPNTPLEYFESIMDIGVNRFSLGVQSLNPRTLSLLGRDHKAEDGYRAIEFLQHRARVNCDLIYGLRDQTVDEAISDLSFITKHTTISHLSWYELQIEPNTKFYQTPEIKGADEHLENIESSAQEFLSEWEHYEISAFAKQKEYSQHNCTYWTYGDYLGFGAGAHSKITSLPMNRSMRFFKTRYPKDYINNQKWIYDPGVDEALDFLLLRLRLFQPIMPHELKKLSPQSQHQIISWIKHDRRLADFLLEAKDNSICINPEIHSHLSTILLWFDEWRSNTRF
ncbi:MAG: radical SAM family heme chaperone HemW [Gammaproteobacteria bacterium]|nr:radical SAM family heme chaperone HemW [Gammaproteobacteria bacterium]